MRKTPLLKRRENNLGLYLMALPGFLVLFIFCYCPMFGIILAFKDYNFSDGILGSPWVGFDNFVFFFQSGVAWRLIRNTVGLNLLFMVFGQLMGVTAAIFLNEIFEKRVAKAYQSILFFPHFISWVIVGYFTFALFNGDKGLLNNFLHVIGMEPVNWYGEASVWPAIMTIISVWKGCGYFSIIYLAGIVGINPEYYEAARIDGAKKRHEIRYVTLPFLKPLIMVNVFLALGRVFYANFDFFVNVTRSSGQIMETTDVVDTFVVRSLTVMGDFNMSAEVGLFQGVCGLILILTANMLVNKFDKESAVF